MLVCDLKAVAEVDHDLFNLFKCHEESFSKWQFLFFSLNWEVQHVAKKTKTVKQPVDEKEGDLTVHNAVLKYAVIKHHSVFFLALLSQWQFLFAISPSLL